MGLQAIYRHKRPRILSINKKSTQIYCVIWVLQILIGLRGWHHLNPYKAWIYDSHHGYVQTVFDRLAALQTLEGLFCLKSLQLALQQEKLKIFNSDQGAQFITQAFTSELGAAGVLVSMAGNRRAYDNIYIERLWWIIKYEEINIKEYVSGIELQRVCRTIHGWIITKNRIKDWVAWPLQKFSTWISIVQGSH